MKKLFKRRRFIHSRKKKGLFKNLLLIFILAAFLVGIFAAGSLFFFIRDLPSPQSLGSRQIVESTKIYDREEETLLYELFEEERRTIIPFDQIPSTVKEATVAIEDANFYTHNAVDPSAIFRALIANLKERGISQGASTITQQLAKNLFLTPERTFSRKAKELILAFQLEDQFSKDEIHGLSLNQIPYGANAYGIESAAKTYFKKSVEDLSLAETALLVSLPQAPSYYSPWGSHVEELLKRKDFTLERMQALGFVSEQEKTEAQEEELEFEEPSSALKAPHFAIAVQEYLNNKYGEDFVRKAGLKVVTTLDWELQEIAQRVVEEGVERNTELYNGTNGALIAQDTNTGQILSMVGSKNYFDTENDGNFNVATQGLRQPGSSLKPFVYLTAFKNGFTPETIVFDAETEFNAAGSGSYKPQNFDSNFRGPVVLKQALAESINVPSVKTLYLAGMNDVLDIMANFGVSTLTEKARFGLSLVLGGGEVTLQELLSAYSVLAEEGIKRPQTLILRIEDREGKVLEEFEQEEERVIGPEHPRTINNILSDLTLRSGLFQSSFNLTVFPGHDVALKTGTTNDYRDAWAFGYTPNFAVGVWAGNNDNTPMTAQGSSILAAIPMWNAFLSEALRDRDREIFPSTQSEFVNKPMLNGEYIANYQSQGENYPQVHNILFYANKNNPRGAEPRRAIDPQFQNWEESVLAWARANISNFQEGQNYNQAIPVGATLSQLGSGGEEDNNILFLRPENGDNLKANNLELKAELRSKETIEEIKLYLNDELIDQRQGFLNSPYTYRLDTELNEELLKPQNALRLEVENQNNETFEKEIILYSD